MTSTRVPAVLSLAVCVALAGCGGTPAAQPPGATAPSSPAAATATPQPTPGSPQTVAAPAAPGAGCDTPPPALVDIIETALGEDHRLLHAQALAGPRALTYVGGDIADTAGTVAAHSAVWVVSGGTLHALSGSARRATAALPDGRDLGANAGDEYGTAVQTCVQGR